jgi:ATP-binding cassette subfamily B protein
VSDAAATHAAEEADSKAYDSHLLRRLIGYLRPYRLRVAVALVLLLAGSAMQLAGPWLTKVALDRAIPERDTGLLLTLTLAYAVSLVVGFLCEYGQTWLTTWLGQRVMYDLRTEVFGHLSACRSATSTATRWGG